MAGQQPVLGCCTAQQLLCDLGAHFPSLGSGFLLCQRTEVRQVIHCQGFRLCWKFLDCGEGRRTVSHLSRENYRSPFLPLRACQSLRHQQRHFEEIILNVRKSSLNKTHPLHHSSGTCRILNKRGILSKLWYIHLTGKAWRH